MEGYTNVCGNHEDFDNLDIEGRIPSKDIADDEKLLSDQLLSIKVQTHEGNLGIVFSTTKRGLWQCHLCDTHFATAKHVKAHLGTKGHMDKMALSSHPEKLFLHIEKIKETAPQLAYGEPVPPGMEEEMSKEALIKVLLDNYKNSPLIGLEYVVELLEDDKEPSYFCTLCLKCGDPRVILTHLAGIIHKSKFLAINFPKVTNEIQKIYMKMKSSRRAKVELVNFICNKIEEKYGRARLVVMEKQRFEKEKQDIIRTITINHPHLRESAADTYVDLLTPEFINKLDAQLEEKSAEQAAEETAKPGFKKTFHDAKIGCDRSKLRMRKEDSDDDVMVIEQDNGGRKDKSPMTVSSISSDSMSSAAAERRGLKVRGRGPVHSWRSRSRSPHRRSRSPYHHRRSPVPRYYKRSRSRSPYHRYGHLKSPPRRHRSRSPYRRSPNRRSPNRRSPNRRSPNRYHRSKSRSFERHSRSPHRESPSKHKGSKPGKRTDSEKARWEKFRQAVDHIEKLAATKLEYYEQHPEKHPEYTPEWKKFWTQRYKEVQSEGKDPERHDFKKEWAAFWTKRVRELQEEDITKKKEELKKQLGFVDKKPVPKPKLEERPSKKPYKKGSPIPQQKSVGAEKRELSAQKEKEMPEEKLLDAPSDIVYSLRLLTALENLLGSLGPQVNSLLATALSLEKSAQGSSQSLLKDNSVVVLLETVSEKLKGLLLAGIVADNLVPATRRCITCLSEVLKTVPPAAPDPVAQERAIIASQIAAALVAQGKHDVTEEQLEALINTVINMAKSSQKQETNKHMASMEVVKAVMGPGIRGAKTSEGVISGLQLLQSAYNETKRSPKIKTTASSNADNLEDLTEEDLRVLLRNFKELSPEEQQGLIDLLKKMEMTNPQKVERLRKYVVVDPDPQPTVSNRLNRKPSPLSLRDGGFNNPPRAENSKKLDSDSDDDYNYMDILAAASKNVKESEQKKKLAERKEQDAVASLRETKERVASMLGSLPIKPVAPQQKPAIPLQPAPVTPSVVSSVPVIQQQPGYSYPAENSRQPYSNVQPSTQNVAPVTNVTSYSGHQQISASATHSISYANQQHSFSNSSYGASYGMQHQQPQQQQHPQQQHPQQQHPQQHHQQQPQHHQQQPQHHQQQPQHHQQQPQHHHQQQLQHHHQQQPQHHQQLQLHQQQQLHQQPQVHQEQQQQWTDQSYRSSNPYNSHQTQPYSQYTQPYSRQQYY